MKKKIHPAPQEAPSVKTRKNVENSQSVYPKATAVKSWRGVHPQFYENAKVTCVCGHTFTTGSTQKEIHVEICAACHPFFTGEMKYVDVQGRVEKFEKQRQKAAKIKKLQQKRKRKKKEQKQPQTLKEALKSSKV